MNATIAYPPTSWFSPADAIRVVLPGCRYRSRSEAGPTSSCSPVVPVMPSEAVAPDADMDAALQKVAEQDQTAFRILFDHFAPRLKAFVMGKGSAAHLADEIVQETMVKVWRKAHQFDPQRASASTWIFTVARNTRIDLLRKINRPEPDPNDPALVPGAEPLPGEVMGRNQDAASVRSAISELSAEQQDVLRLAYFEERPHPEIAAALGIPLGTVKSRIRLAMKNIRSRLGESQ